MLQLQPLLLSTPCAVSCGDLLWARSGLGWLCLSQREHSGQVDAGAEPNHPALLVQEEWEAEFEKYKKSPEFKLANSTMTVRVGTCWAV